MGKTCWNCGASLEEGGVISPIEKTGPSFDVYTFRFALRSEGDWKLQALLQQMLFDGVAVLLPSVMGMGNQLVNVVAISMHAAPEMTLEVKVRTV